MMQGSDTGKLRGDNPDTVSAWLSTKKGDTRERQYVMSVSRGSGGLSALSVYASNAQARSCDLVREKAGQHNNAMMRPASMS